MSDETNTTDTSTEDTSGLKNKITELHRLLKDEKAARVTAEQAIDDAATAKLDDLAKAQREIKRLTDELKTASEQATASNTSLRDYKLTNALNEAMSTNNVDDGHRSLLSKALKADVEFGEDGEPTISGKSIADYTKSYFAKEGKSYVRPAEHSGSGATGNTTVSTQSRMTKETFNFTDFARIALDNPEEAKAIAHDVGRPELAQGL